MKQNILRWRSLKTRVLLLTLAIFLLGIWSLQFYVSRVLREDIERLLGEQQFSTVSLVAEHINAEMNERLRAVEAVARKVRPGLLGNPAALQHFLEERPAFLVMFNAGLAILDSKGTAIASLPVSVGRIGVNYMERDYIAAALKEGRSSISRPTIAKLLKTPVFGMAAPIRDEQGTVIGVLAGLIDLGKPNFLDRITASRYGKRGGYLLNSPQDRLIITASDKSRVMQPLPAPGVNNLLDRYMQGYEGYGVSVNSRGIEELSAAKGIPVAGWFLGIVLPTAEAFAPIHEMQQRMLLATTLLTLLAGGLIFWLLRRQLEPMIAAARALALISDTNQPLRPLPVVRHDEVGELIGGFNRVLETLGKREKVLNESEARYRDLVETSHDLIWRCDANGCFTFLNKAWETTLGYAREEMLGRPFSEFEHPERAPQDLEEFGRHLAGGSVVGYETVQISKAGVDVVLLFNAIPLHDSESRVVGAQGTASDITERKHAALLLTESESRRFAEMSAALEVQNQSSRAALSLMEDAIAARQRAESLSLALNEQLDELRRWQQVTLNRESRILSAKKEINDLLAEHGQPPRYPSAAERGGKSEPPHFDPQQRTRHAVAG